MSLMQQFISNTEQMMRRKYAFEGSGHDWQHINRVRRTALVLAKHEGADSNLVELSALLHDLDDHKFTHGDYEVGARSISNWLQSLGAEEELIERVVKIRNEVSFKGAGVATPVSSIEAAVVQDADRLDAIGAIGIARAFAYGGSKGRLLYEEDVKPTWHNDFTSYSTDSGHTINHFYEKLLLLKDRMNTHSGRRLAHQRHAFMEEFLEQFMLEWGA